MPKNLRPREKAIFHGVENISDQELLTVFLRSGTRIKSVDYLARDILEQSCGFEKLARMNLSELKLIEGMTTLKAIEILVLFEIAKRSMLPSLSDKIEMNHPSKISEWLKVTIGQQNQEVFMAFFLNVRKELIGYKKLFVGTLDQSLIHPREVFKHAVNLSASSIIVAHNHPAGTTTPSVLDCQITERLVISGKMIGIEVIDHIIVTSTDYVSLRETSSFLFK